MNRLAYHADNDRQGRHRGAALPRQARPADIGVGARNPETNPIRRRACVT